jgi:hypothetical protein
MQGYVVSNLHLLSGRSAPTSTLEAIRRALSVADFLVLNGSRASPTKGFASTTRVQGRAEDVSLCCRCASEDSAVTRDVESPSFDCYAAGERGLMERTRRLRSSALRPLLAAMTSARVRADHLTLASLLCGVAFAGSWAMAWPVTALSLLIAHACLDALDGALARHQGLATSRGSFTDTMADQVVVA